MSLPDPNDSATLPDLLRSHLAVVFVGINPSLYSVEQGHYFARRTNRFWPALSRSVLSLGAREGIGVDMLLPEHDRLLPEYGFGFTDVVKRASARASEVAPAEFAQGVKDLRAKLEEFAPRFACFHGVTGFRPLYQALNGNRAEPRLGLQDFVIGKTRLFLAPNPSGANAHFKLADQTRAYDELAGWVEKPSGSFP